MSITATVENDTIKLPAGVHLPNGTTVKIEAVVEPERQPSGKTFTERFAKYVGMVDDMPQKPAKDSDPTLAERLSSFIGVAKNLPPDLAENHDHYLYGTPKRKP